MRKKRNLLCLLLTILLVVQTAVLFVPASVLAAEDVQTYYVSPKLSDGLTVTDLDPSSMLVKGTLSDGMFKFTEDVNITFTVEVEDGWTYNSDYSRFFKYEDKNRTVEQKNGAITFTFKANAGYSVEFSDLTMVLINATPDKLPQLSITLDGDFSDVNKEEWTDAEFELTAGTKQFSSGNTYSGKGSVKGRGNTSWEKPQKPYSIKLSKKASLLGIPETKKYAIIASYSDPSLMRNYITYKSALSMVGFQYVPKIEFVEVRLNGVYSGVYALVERIDIEKTKVNIEEATADDPTGGYIIEKDAGNKIDWHSDPWFWAPFQSNPGEDVFTLKAPDPDDPADLVPMLGYLDKYMQDVHGAIMGNSGAKYTDYVDSSSWADFLVLQELTKNIDGNLKTSCYFVKEKGTDILRMDAPWDFDLAYGIADWNNACQNNDGWDCPYGTGVSDFMVINSSCPWFKKLYSYKEFADLTKERYSQYRAQMIPNMQNMIYEQSAYLSKAAVSHTDKWGEWSVGRMDYEAQKLSGWLDGRVDWLDKQWLDKSKQTLTLSTSVEGSGNVSANSDVVYGTSTSVTITPDKGSELVSVMWNGIDVTNEVKDGVYQTPIMTENAELTVVFESDLNTNKVTTELEHGTSDAPETVTEGDSLTVTLIPDEGYILPKTVTVTIDGETLDPENYIYDSTTGEITIPADSLTGDVCIYASFPKEESMTYKVNTELEHGTSDAPETVTEGEPFTVTLIPDEGYILPETVTVTIDNETLNPENYTYDSTTGEITIPADSLTGDVCIYASFPEEKPAPSLPELGDVNGDGEIDSTDATLVLQRFAEIITKDKDGYYDAVADVNGDGEVDSTDATFILQKFAEIIEEFTKPQE